MALFQELVAAGMTLILVTHEPDIAAHAARVIEMRDGQVMSDESRTPVPAVVPAAEASETAMGGPGGIPGASDLDDIDDERFPL